MNNYDIIIIGCGASTVTFLASLVSEYNIKDKTFRILIVDKSENISTGNVYKKDYPWLKMNSYSENLSVYQNQPDHFVEYLKLKLSSEEIEEGYVPSRNIFGEYLSFCYKDIIEQAEQKNISIHHVDDTIIDIDVSEKRVFLQKKQIHISFSKLVISTGLYRQRDIYKLKDNSNYFNNPYPLKEKLAALGNKKNIGILGASLTASDILISLNETGFKGNVSFITRNGQLPNIKCFTPEEIKLNYLNENFVAKVLQSGKIELEEIIKRIKLEFDGRDKDFQNIYYTKDKKFETVADFNNKLRELELGDNYFEFRLAVHYALNPVWPFLSAEEIGFVHEEIVNNVYYYNGCIPYEVAQKLYYAMEDLNFSSIYGVVGIEKEGENFIVKATDNSYMFDIIINATGPSHEEFYKINNPLIDKIYGQFNSNCIYSKHPYNLDPKSSTLILNEKIKLNDIYVIGYAAHIQHPFNNCFVNIRQVNYKAAKSIIRKDNKATMYEEDNNAIGLNF